MKQFAWVALAAALLLAGWMDSPFRGQAQPSQTTSSAKTTAKDDGTPKLPDFDKLVKGAKEHDGLFKLYEKGENVYAEIKQSQFNRPLLAPIAIARGSGLGGYTLNFDEQWVLVFKKVSDTKLHLIRRNVHFKAAAGSPVARAVETTYTDSVLMAIPIKSVNHSRQSVLIDLGDIFMTDFADLGFGSFDRSRSTWGKIKAFPRNIEVQVQATFSGGRYFFWGDDSNIDSRGRTIVMHYGLVELPESGYTPRLADDRVGYFLSVTKDFSSDSKDTNFLRYVNRWRLERADTDPKHKNKLSVPKKKIIFWIENSVPFEYRAYVREGILEWNKAFEKIGFRDAIEVRQQEGEEFDPEDMNYNTFRWITTGGAFAMGPSRANPFTGELLDADIIFDADMVRFWKLEAKLMGAGTTSFMDHPSPIMAIKQGHGLMPPPGKGGNALSWDKRDQHHEPGVPPHDPRMKLWAIQHGICQCAARMKYELGLAAMTLAARGQVKGNDGVPEELIGQAIKSVVMHEVGHTLGLRHNFKASTMLKNEQLHDKTITSKLGLSGSVMDYLPANLAPKGTKQGDYFTTTIGPYDYWAIEYAYKPLSGGTEGEYARLQEIANKGALPGHDYGTDEDLFASADPHINAFDLGSDPMKYGMDRMRLAEELLKTLSDKTVEKGEGYQRTRMAFMMLLGEYANGAYLLSQFVGGEHIHRDHRGDPKGRDPFLPVKADRQRKALAFLQEHILSEKYFKFSPQLLRRLAADRWMHWGNQGTFYSVDVPVNQYVLSIQRVVLRNLLDAGTLTRIQNNALKVDNGEKPLTQAEVFRTLTEGIWSEYPVKGVAEGKAGESSVIRRNLQRQHVKDLSNIVLGQRSSGFLFYFGPSVPMPPDARSLARHHLKELQQRIDHALKDKGMAADDLITTRAHLEECRERIGRVLTASLQVND